MNTRADHGGWPHACRRSPGMGGNLVPVPGTGGGSR
jgi:hypothetical protein